MALNLQLDRESPVPLARQIQEQIERLIREGWLAPGREAAGDAGAGPDARRQPDHRRARLRGAGGRAAGRGPTWGRGPSSRRPRPARSAPGAVDSRARSRSTGRACSRGALTSPARGRSGGRAAPGGARPLISFAEGTPDSGLFPTDAFRRVLNQVVRAGGLGAPPVPAGRRRLSAASRVPRHVPPAVRRRGAGRRHPRRQRLPAGLRPDRADVHRSGRRRRDGAADLPARDRTCSGRRAPSSCPCPGTARGRRPTPSSRCWRATGRSSSTASRPPTTRPGSR